MDPTAAEAVSPSPAGGPSLALRLLLVGGVVVYWALLFVGTHLPGDPSLRPTQSLPHIDKVVHAAAFAGLAILLLAGLTGWWRPGVGLGVTVILLLATYAGLDELTQGLVRHREPDLRDWVADVLGVLVGTAVFFKAWPLVTRRAAQTSAA
jgi:VanZ family protein